MENIKNMKYSAYEIADIMERYASKIGDGTRHDYGTGQLFTNREVHTISYIGKYPGITVTEFAKKWTKTKGAVSQMVKKLEEMGLLERVKRKGNNKNIELYLTDKGKILDEKHKEYDHYGMYLILNALINKYSVEDVNLAFSIVEDYAKIIDDYSGQNKR